MRYTLEIEIDLKRDDVIMLFDNPDNLKHWQEGFVKFEHLSGTPGQPGAQSRLTYRRGKKEFDMIETITTKNLPDEFSGTFEIKGATSKLSNYFHDLGDHRTKWVSEVEFQGKGMVKLMMLLMPGAFKKQSYKFMAAFKKFAEEQKSVALSDS